MADVIAVTSSQQLVLNVFDLVSNNKAAASAANAFIGNSQLNYELFTRYFAQTVAQPDPVARTISAVSLATDALSLFPTS